MVLGELKKQTQTINKVLEDGAESLIDDNHN